MKLLLTLLILVSVINVSQCRTKNQTTIKYQIQHDEIIKERFKPYYSESDDPDKQADAIFYVLFKRTIDKNLETIKAHGIPVIQKNHDTISDADYKAIFKGEKNFDIDSREEELHIILVDSICAYYGIERKDLIKIRQSEHLISKKKKGIIALFETCIKPLNEKINKDRERQKQNEIADLVVKKLEKKDNVLSIPLAPTLPTDIFF